MKSTSKLLFLVFLPICFLIFACNSCVPQQTSNKATAYTGSSKKSLIGYINKRTVRIATQGRTYNIKTHAATKFKDMGWGTGTIIYSSKDFSLIQTANHVVNDKLASIDGFTVTLKRYVLEKRDLNNKVLSRIYSVKIEERFKDIDIAILRVDQNLSVSSIMARSSVLGENVAILGYPFMKGFKGHQLSYSRGYIATANIKRENSIETVPGLVRIATFGYYGSSGASVWNSSGEILAVVTFITGFNLGGIRFIPQQDCTWGVGIISIRKFYRKSKYRKYLIKD